VTRLYLVRHGRAAAGWDVDVDPGLDALGAHQARAVCEGLAPLGPLRIVTSPLRRCRETAQVLAARWDVMPMVEAGVGEIPSPEGIPMSGRVAWLRAAMQGSWTELGDRYVTYRDSVVSTLRALAADRPDTDVVVFSHFVAINAVVGAVLGDDRVLIHRLDNCSVTIVDVADGELSVVESGREADTQIR
jgi:broad specificity phosphatase PhoE